ncbi:MAG TPA: hypothetical protein VMW83_09220 [Spirochaetia bacterium]|nr:hypothetical protein [Spirochaetia bacterium]
MLLTGYQKGIKDTIALVRESVLPVAVMVGGNYVNEGCKSTWERTMSVPRSWTP